MSLALFFISSLILGCTTSQLAPGLITINISADKKEYQVKIAPGSTVQEALKSTKIMLSEMDKVEPPLYTVLSDGSQVKVIRLREEYSTEQVTIPFGHQELKNEALPEGERRLSQPGVNGLEEITYRRVFEDSVQVSNDIVKTVVIKEAVPEVVMVGSQSSLESFDTPGKIAFLSAGNAWLVENDTGSRRLLVPTGDLDGRIFSLSRDGKYLLFTRLSSDEQTINSLWAASLSGDEVKLTDLGVRNIVHFAEFNPVSSVVAYSTAEWRDTSPGWQANNDLVELSLNGDGSIGPVRQVLDSNLGGVYGWWGMDFLWAPDGEKLLFSRPDGIGLIDSLDGSFTSLLAITPYQTGADWAWVPGAAWSPDGNIIYAVNSVSIGENQPQEFDLVAIPVNGDAPISLVKNLGMFAYPVPSPVDEISGFIYNSQGDDINQLAFSVAYLQAVFPDQSETSKYRLEIMDRDGSNRKSLFPAQEAIGLDPQQVVWSPDRMGDDDNYAIAVIYNGNIWIIDSGSGAARQVTGDGLTSRLDWR